MKRIMGLLCIIFLSHSYTHATLSENLHAYIQETIAVTKPTLTRLVSNDSGRRMAVLNSVVAFVSLIAGIKTFISLMRTTNHTRIGTVLHGSNKSTIRYSPLTKASQNYLNAMTQEDFEQHYYACIATIPENVFSSVRQELLQCYNLYQFAGFRNMIKQWPEYEHHVLNTYKQLQTNKSFLRRLNTIQGFDYGGLSAYFKEQVDRLQAKNVFKKSFSKST